MRMSHASSAAGMGFGNAGMHLCHGMSYTVVSQVKGGCITEGYPRRAAAPDVDDDNDGRHGLVAHGLSVAIWALSVFWFTGAPGKNGDPIAKMYSRDRHWECAAILADARIRRRWTSDGAVGHMRVPSEMAMWDLPGEALACELLELTNKLRVPVGIRLLGYDESNVKSLAPGTLPQHRVTKLSPRQPMEMDELRALFAVC
jgi:hydroxyacid-oxoacid transhydrogenase